MLSRSLQDAKQAYEKNNPELSRLAHSGETAPFCAEQGHKTFAVAPGVRNHVRAILQSGNQALLVASVLISTILSLELTITSNQIVQLGVAMLFSVGVALGYNAFLEKKAEKTVFEQEYKREKWECDNYLEGEQKEMVELYVSKGMTQADAETVIKLLSKNEKMFVDIMMVEELGLLPYNDLNPVWNGCVRFLGFVLIGCVPFLPFSQLLLANPATVYNLQSTAYHSSLALSAVSLAFVGFLKETFHLDVGSWWKQGTITLLSLPLAVLPSLAAGGLLKPLLM